ncbi:MAG: PSD1 and planctomycete cytochrome C domain-containing protein [Pirellulales bacterium]
MHRTGSHCLGSLPRLLLAVGLACLHSTAWADAKPAGELKYEADVLPILQAKCGRCHGTDDPKAGFKIATKALLLKGGQSGPAVHIGAAQSSLLWEKIVADQMPPEGDKLTAEEKALVKAWIDAGAKGEGATAADDVLAETTTDDDRRWWSFVSPVRPSVPAVRQVDRVQNPIDAFLLQSLEQKGLGYSPEADRRTLIRRLSYDLTGLPPTPQETDNFLADTAAGAYERLVDRLLASPRYGERWGRHWLDAAGYADSEGILDADYIRTAAWRYRDYVIAAFNKDKPYDRFLREQIAGDELVDYWGALATQPAFSPEVLEAVIATGYLRCASDTSRPDFANIKNAPSYYYQTLDDTLRIVSSSTMALTMQCCKCHSHKYDPLPQVEYYRLQAVFMSAYRPAEWVPQVNRRLVEGTQAQQTAANDHNARIDAAIGQIAKEIEELKSQFAPRLFEERLAKLPMQIQADVKAALDAPADQRTDVQKYLVEKFQAELRPTAEAQLKALKETYAEFKASCEQHEAGIAAEAAKKITLPEIRAIYDLPGQAQTPLLLRGDYRTPGPLVEPGVPTALAVAGGLNWSAPPEEAKTSGRRLAFARWLTQPNHPLTARVMVNRMWMHHFGEGIVSTPDDFGTMGALPSHPQLLDWLATEFVEGGWSIKQIHRLMVGSAAYRQQSVRDPGNVAAQEADPDNRLLWRQRLKRLEAESLRDAMLAVAGNLNREMGGQPVGVARTGEGEVITAAGSPGWRRSIYLLNRRSTPVTLLQLFDQPVMETNCARRGQSTVSLQALALLNSDFLAAQAAEFAARIERENASDPIGQAVRLAFGREIAEEQRAKLASFVELQAVRLLAGQTGPTPEQQADARHRALVDVCQMLLSANEFAYVD